MSLPTIFSACRPRADVVGSIRDGELMADRSRVVNHTAPADYLDPIAFFAKSYPTRGMKELLKAVCLRLSGKGGANLPNFVDPATLPSISPRLLVKTPTRQRPLPRTRPLAHSLWGEMAYRLAGRNGSERVRQSDERHIAPGAETIRELFGGQPSSSSRTEPAGTSDARDIPHIPLHINPAIKRRPVLHLLPTTYNQRLRDGTKTQAINQRSVPKRRYRLSLPRQTQK